MIDTHTHLNLNNFTNDLAEVIEKAQANGVEYLIVPGIDLITSIRAVEIANKFTNVYAAVGYHPEDADKFDTNSIKELTELAKNEKVLAIGEIGLDYYWKNVPPEIQIKVFKEQLDLALELNKPVIIHNRESNDEMLNIIKSYSRTKLKAQFHCFSGDLNMAIELIKLHHFISFTGNITFPNAKNLRELLKHIQVDDLLLETDSPFMAPQGYRGKRNEPKYLPIIAQKIAEIQNIPIEDVIRTTNTNAFRLFGIGKEPSLVYTYKIGNSLYVNVTNRCNADCIFCDRKGEAIISGYKLKMKKEQEPPAEVYIKEIGDPKQYKDIVFCGYGEPTIRWDIVKEVAKYIKENGGKTRMNTNGHGNIINKRDITPELKNLIDTVSISLNSVYPDEYARLMKVPANYHKEMLDFAKKAKNYTNVVMSVVGLPDVDLQKAKELIENEIGVTFRLRELF
ncbi:MAG TPA: YchF/TatD family DNA exonuclease [Ignavibacteriales bacterium]|nr:YchF/TatD family DNA exonuclease [Ignavibacteriales bacterium]HOL81338.1 YchF/TatD family DNA exonuclease [Ignavibacteriales bacterium]HPP33893.1 YchF/TatD family DNA exonuclease [Ignavibacteriales bacterium]